MKNSNLAGYGIKGWVKHSRHVATYQMKASLILKFFALTGEQVIEKYSVDHIA
jgi:hypothetical protein